MAKLRTVLFSAALLGLVACGSGDDDGGASDVDETPEAADDTPAVDEPADDEPADEPADDPAPAGDGTGTLTLPDGTAFSFEMTTCETSENGADGFLIEDGFDLFGRTTDGEFTVQLIRAGFDEENIVDTAGLEGEFDDDGKNAGLLYSEVHESLAATVDGGTVTGTVSLKPIGPNRPYGDETVATFDIRC
jgi:hypothetical protein